MHMTIKRSDRPLRLQLQHLIQAHSYNAHSWNHGETL